MAKAKRERRTSIRTMQADVAALEALESLERAERPAAEPGEPPSEGEPATAGTSTAETEGK